MPTKLQEKSVYAIVLAKYRHPAAPHAMDFDAVIDESVSRGRHRQSLNQV